MADPGPIFCLALFSTILEIKKCRLFAVKRSDTLLITKGCTFTFVLKAVLWILTTYFSRVSIRYVVRFFFSPWEDRFYCYKACSFCRGTSGEEKRKKQDTGSNVWEHLTDISCKENILLSSPNPHYFVCLPFSRLSGNAVNIFCEWAIAGRYWKRDVKLLVPLCPTQSLPGPEEKPVDITVTFYSFSVFNTEKSKVFKKSNTFCTKREPDLST